MSSPGVQRPARVQRLSHGRCFDPLQGVALLGTPTGTRYPLAQRPTYPPCRTRFHCSWLGTRGLRNRPASPFYPVARLKCYRGEIGRAVTRSRMRTLTTRFQRRYRYCEDGGVHTTERTIDCSVQYEQGCAKETASTEALWLRRLKSS